MQNKRLTIARAKELVTMLIAVDTISESQVRAEARADARYLLVDSMNEHRVSWYEGKVYAFWNKEIKKRYPDKKNYYSAF